MKNLELDEKDLIIIKELEVDGRKSTTELARKIGSSTAAASRRIRKLLDRRVINVTAVPSMSVLGYNVMATIGMKVIPGQLSAVADKLASNSSVYWVFVSSGPFDLVAWVLACDNEELVRFIKADLGSIDGLASIETMMNPDMVKYSYTLPVKHDNQITTGAAEASFHSPLVNAQTLLMIKELQVDGRKSIAEVGRAAGLNKVTASRKIKKLINDGIITITVNKYPPAFGYRTMAMIGVNVSAGKMDAVSQELASYQNAHWVFTAVGRYDVMAWMLFRQPRNLSDFMRDQIGCIEGVRNIETIINLDIVKFSYAYL